MSSNGFLDGLTSDEMRVMRMTLRSANPRLERADSDTVQAELSALDQTSEAELRRRERRLVAQSMRLVEEMERSNAAFDRNIQRARQSRPPLRRGTQFSIFHRRRRQPLRGQAQTQSLRPSLLGQSRSQSRRPLRRRRQSQTQSRR